MAELDTTEINGENTYLTNNSVYIVTDDEGSTTVNFNERLIELEEEDVVALINENGHLIMNLNMERFPSGNPFHIDENGYLIYTTP